MKNLLKTFLILIIIASTLLCFGCKKDEKPSDSVTSEPWPDDFFLPEINNEGGNEVIIQKPSDGIIMIDDTADFKATFKNPMLYYKVMPEAKKNSFGDPYMMRWNGRYYLYPSPVSDPYVHVWVSDDMVNWSYGAAVTEKNDVYGAYAPEVVYYNGYFYMYTSPEGNGHYVLKADNPLGPFEKISKNVNMSIDGDVFIDDDGSWYFYHANGKGIICHPMTSPANFKTEINTGSYMDGWTEGPMIIKYNGTYYMTYTGNHVATVGYRVDYSTSHKKPTSFIRSKANPLIINADKRYEPWSLGHSSTVIGPNLDSYYLVYHCRGWEGGRNMCYDRLVINGDHMEALGPTGYDMEAPSMPDIYSRFEKASDADDWILKDAKIFSECLLLNEGGCAISKAPLNGNFTAEFNMQTVNGKAGTVFCYKDWKNYATALFNAENQSIDVTCVIDGISTEKSFKISKSFDEDVRFEVLQLLTVRRYGNRFTFFFNSRTMGTLEAELPDGRFGVISTEKTALVGFVGATASACLESVKTYHKPIDGKLNAITCYETGLELVEYNNSSYVVSKEGDTFNYYVNVEKTGNYSLSVNYRSEEGAEIEAYQDGKLISTVKLPAGSKRKTLTVFERGVKLLSGTSVITFKIKSGNADIFEYYFELYEKAKNTSVDYSKTESYDYSDGTWTVSGGTLKPTGYAKRLYGDRTWADYSFEADVAVGSNTNFGIMVRTRNPSTGGANDNPQLGIYFFQGYLLKLERNAIQLDKVNYVIDTKLERKAIPALVTGETVKIKIEAVGATIKVFVNNQLSIEYTDQDNPYMTGMAGFWSADGNCSVDKFTLNAN